MFEYIRYPNEKVDKQEQGKEYPWWVTHKVFLNTKSQEKGQAETNGRKDMENKGQFHLRSILRDYDIHHRAIDFIRAEDIFLLKIVCYPVEMYAINRPGS